MGGAVREVLVTGCAVLYIVWSIPFRCCFLEKFDFSRDYLIWWIFDYVADVALLAFVERRTLWYNVAAALPLELLGRRRASLAPFKLNRMLRLAQAPRLANTLFRLLESELEIGALRMWFFFFVMAVAAHWSACCFYLASRYDSSRHWARQRVDSTWGEEDSLWRKIEDDVDFLVPIGHRYSRAYYWALVTMITTGFGDITPQTRTETMVCVVSMYVGMSIACLAIANLTNLVMSSNKDFIEHRGRIDAVRQYGTYRRLQESTVRRMIDFVEHKWGQLHGIDEDTFRSELPESLRQRCVKLKLENLLRRLPALHGGLANDAFINALALRLTTSMFSPSDQIIRPGERLDGAILVSSGEADVFSRKSKRDSPCINSDLLSQQKLFSSSRPNEGFAAADGDDDHGRERSFSAMSSSSQGDGYADLTAKDTHRGHHSPQKSCPAATSHIVVRLREGDNFGLSSLFTIQQSKFLVEARTFCEIFWLPRARFVSVCREQCTAEQVEAMSRAMQAKSSNCVRAMLYAGFGTSTKSNAQSMRHKRWASRIGVSDTLFSHRKKFAHSLRRVLPSSSVSSVSSSSSKSLLLSKIASSRRSNLKICPVDSSSDVDEALPASHSSKSAATAGEDATLGSPTFSTASRMRLLLPDSDSFRLPKTPLLLPGTVSRDVYELVKMGVLVFYLVTIPLATKTVYSRCFAGHSGIYSLFFSQSLKGRMLGASYVCDAFLAVDLLGRATVLPTMAQGVMVTRGSELRALLFTRRPISFLVEALSLLPWDALSMAYPVLFEGNGAMGSLSTCALARLAKIGILIVRLGPQTTLVLGSAAARLPILSKQVQLIIKLNVGMILACHWIGCYWIFIGRLSKRYYGNRVENNWIALDRFYNDTVVPLPTSRKAIEMRYDSSRWNHHSCAATSQYSICTYTRAVYFAIVAMSTVGYGDIKPHASNVIETVFTSAVILFGGLLLPSVVGGLASLMADLNKGVREYRAKLSELYASMQRQRLSPNLQSALLQYHDYVWTRQKGVDELSVLAYLPVPTRRAVLNQTIGLALSSAPFFSRALGVEDVAREELVSKLEPRTFLPGDVILAESDLSKLSMFLIERGNVDLYASKAGLKALDDARKRLASRFSELKKPLVPLDVAGRQSKRRSKLRRNDDSFGGGIVGQDLCPPPPRRSSCQQEEEEASSPTRRRASLCDVVIEKSKQRRSTVHSGDLREKSARLTGDLSESIKARSFSIDVEEAVEKPNNGKPPASSGSSWRMSLMTSTVSNRRKKIMSSRTMRLRPAAIKSPSKTVEEQPVLKALCQPVMRRGAGEYFGAECLLETSQLEKKGLHWSHALQYASNVVQRERKRSAAAAAGLEEVEGDDDESHKLLSSHRAKTTLNFGSGGAPKIMQMVMQERQKKAKEAYMRLAPRTSTVAAKHTDCYELGRTQFFDVLKGFPSSAIVISNELTEQCRAEHRRVTAILANIARFHFSNQCASRVKYAASSFYSYVTENEDEICKLATCPETISTLSGRDSVKRPAVEESTMSKGAMPSPHRSVRRLSRSGPSATSRRLIRKSIDAGNNAMKSVRRLSRSYASGRAPLPTGSSRLWGRRQSRGSGSFRRPKKTVFFGAGGENSFKRRSLGARNLSEMLADLKKAKHLSGETGFWLTRWPRRISYWVRKSLRDPESRGAVLWSGIMVGVVTYYLFSTPLHAAFVPPVTWRRYAVDWFCDVLGLCDVIFRSCVIGYGHNGRLVTDPRRILRHQLRTGEIYFNVFVSVPYEVVPLALLGQRHLPWKRVAAWRRATVAWSRAPKLLRACRLNSLMYAARPLFDTVEARVGYRKATLFRLLGAVVLVSHIAACCFFSLARYRQLLAPGAESSASRRWRCTWIRHQVSQGFLRVRTGFHVKDLPKQYLRALNWALPTLVVVVIGDVTPASCLETAFCFCCIAAGMTVNAMIIGQVVAAVANSDASSTELRMRADRLETFMQKHKMPLQLRRRVNAFMSSLQMSTDQVDSVTGTLSSKALAQSALPHTLRARVCAAVRLPVLARCPIFELCPEVIRRAIALHLTPETYSSGDVVIQFGDRGEAMYFLIRGTVQVLAENGKTIYATLKADSFFGEGALFTNIRRVASVRCTCFSEALRLSRFDVQNQLRAFCFDGQVLEDNFNLISIRNKLRNAALRANLKRAKDPLHRLFSLVGIVEPEKPIEVQPHDDERTVKMKAMMSSRWQQQQKQKRCRDLIAPVLAVQRWWRLKFAQVARIEGLSPAAGAVWYALAALLALYSAAQIPYRAVFTLPSNLVDTVPGRMTVDYLCDAFFVISLFVRYQFSVSSRRQYRGNSASSHEACVSATAEVEVSYNRSRHFALDLLAELPLEFAVLLTRSDNSSERACNLALALRMNRLLRLVRVQGYASHFADYTTLRHGIRISAAQTAILAVFLCYVMCNHWYACVWFAVHRYLEKRARQTWASADFLALRGPSAPSRKAEPDARVCRVAVTDCYTRSVHMVITTISSVGYGDIKPITPLETIWQLVVVVSGACLFASLIGAFTLLLEEIDTEGTSAFNAKLQKYDAYMRRANFPSLLRSAIVAHHQHRFDRMRCIDSKALTRELTAPLRTELLYILHRPAFENIQVLSAIPLSTAKRFAEILSSQVCLGSDHVYRAGEVGWDVYFISSGAVSLKPPKDGSVLDAYGRESFSCDSHGSARAKAIFEKTLPSGDGKRANKSKGQQAALITRDSVTASTILQNGNAEANFERFSDSFADARRETEDDTPNTYRPIYGILSQGDHFGEYCLRFNSGVRRETATAVNRLELYTVARRDLEERVLRYESDDVLTMLNSLFQIHCSLPPETPTTGRSTSRSSS